MKVRPDRSTPVLYDRYMVPLLFELVAVAVGPSTSVSHGSTSIGIVCRRQPGLRRRGLDAAITAVFAANAGEYGSSR